MGFKSAGDYGSFEAVQKRLIDDSGTDQGWSEQDFDSFASLLKGGNETAITTVIAVAGRLGERDQERRVISALGTRAIPQSELGYWALAFKSWSQSTASPPILPELLRSSNPGVVEVAKEVIREENQYSGKAGG